MGALAASVLHYLLWPGLTLATLTLWVAAILDIDRHRRMGTSTRARLACMACCVSVAAVAAIAWEGALFAERWAVVGTETAALRSEEEAGASPAAIFSFGLENASYTATSDPARQHPNDR